MSKNRSLPPLSESQLEIMDFVWKQSSITVLEVLELLQSRHPEKNTARNTVQTLMVRMEEKGWLTHRVVGRTFVYSATRSKTATLRQSAKQLLNNAFGGSAENLVNALLENHSLSAEEADRIREMIDAAEQQTKPTANRKSKRGRNE